MPVYVQHEGFEYGPYPDEMAPSAIKADIDSHLKDRAYFRKQAIQQAQNKASEFSPIKSVLRDVGVHGWQSLKKTLNDLGKHPLDTMAAPFQNIGAHPNFDPKQELMGAMNASPLTAPLAQWMQGNDPTRATGDALADTALVAATRGFSAERPNVAAQPNMPIFTEAPPSILDKVGGHLANEAVSKLPSGTIVGDKIKAAASQPRQKLAGYQNMQDVLNNSVYGDAPNQPLLKPDPTAALVGNRFFAPVTEGATENIVPPPVDELGGLGIKSGKPVGFTGHSFDFKTGNSAGPVPPPSGGMPSPPLQDPPMQLPNQWQGEAPQSANAAFGDAPNQPLQTTPGAHQVPPMFNLNNAMKPFPGTFFSPEEFTNIMKTLAQNSNTNTSFVKDFLSHPEYTGK